MSLIEFNNVSKHYTTKGRSGSRRVEALRDITFTVAKSEFVSIVGPSGCGKTTCLRILAGLETFDSGEVTVAGVPVRGPERNRATVFQSFNLFPWMTVSENIEFPLKVQGMGKEERAAVSQSYVELVGLQEFERHYPYQLSGGMQQRVGIARAFASGAEILLMDEPFGALDAQTREVLQDELLAILQRDKKTVIFVTHSIDEAVYMSDRIALFHPRPGRLSEIFDVPFGPDRPGSRVRSTPEFGALRQRVSDRLKGGLERAI